MSQAPLELSKVLADVGHRLKGAADAISAEELISSLDCVRHAALTNNEEVLSFKPSPLLPDSLIPSRLFLHDSLNKTENDTASEGRIDLQKYVNVVVVGACMMETRTACFPVTILFSKKRQILLVYGHGVCISTLEADLYDSAFGECKFEDFVLKKEAVWLKSARREAAVAGRKIGFDKMPEFMAGGDDMHAVRYGIVPFLCLRTVKNSAELCMVKNALRKVLEAVPVGKALEEEAKECRGIQLATLFETGDPIVPCEAPPANTDSICSCSNVIAKRSVLTAVAVCILQKVNDDSTDSNGELISETNLQIGNSTENENVIEEVKASEIAVVQASAVTSMTDLQLNVDEPPTLPQAMKDVRPLYCTKLIARSDGAGMEKVVESVAYALFSLEDAGKAVSLCFDEASRALTVDSALRVLGKCISQEQSLVIAQRDSDGRLSNIKAVGSSRSIDQVGIKSFRRYVIYPWAAIVIVDKGRVFELQIREPDTIELPELRKEKLRLKENKATTQEQPMDTKKLEAKIDALSEALTSTTEQLSSVMAMLLGAQKSNESLTNEKQSMYAAIKELSEKVHKIESQTRETESACIVHVSASAPPPTPTKAPPSSPLVDETAVNLKRTLEKIESYSKRIRLQSEAE